MKIENQLDRASITLRQAQDDREGKRKKNEK